MGSRVVVSIGIVLLIAGGQTWAAAKKQLSASAKETLNQIWPDGDVAGPRPRAHLSYQLRIYQLRRPDTEKEQQKPLEDPQRQEDAGGHPEQLGIEKPVHRLIPIQGPDLNPHYEPETRVFLKHTVSLNSATVWLQANSKHSLRWCWSLTTGCRYPPPAWQPTVAKKKLPWKSTRTYLVMVASCLFAWLIHHVSAFLSTWKHLTCRGQVRGPDWKIEWIVKDGTVGADCCKWHRLSDQYCVSANFFHSEKETFCFHLLVRYADFTQEGGGGEPFYLSCRWTGVLLTGLGKETASGNGSLFKWHLSAFVLRQRSAYLSKWSDLRRLRCSIDHRPHPAVPDRVAWLQQHVKCMHAFFLFYFFQHYTFSNV